MKNINYLKMYHSKQKKLKRLTFIFLSLALLSISLFIVGEIINDAFPEKVTTLKEIENAPYYRKVEIEAFDYQYLNKTDENDDGNITYYYYMLHLKDGYIIAKHRSLSNDNTPLIFKSLVSKDDNNYSNRFSFLSLGYNTADFENNFSTKILDNASNNPILPILFSIIFSIFSLIYFLIYRGNKSNFNRLEKFTPADVASTNFQLEQSSEQAIIYTKNQCITQSWFLHLTRRTIFLYPLSEVVWVYGHVTQHKTYGINSGKSYAVKIYLSDKKEIFLSLNQREMNAVIHSIRNNNPRVVTGYSDALLSKWGKIRDTKEWY